MNEHVGALRPERRPIAETPTDDRYIKANLGDPDGLARAASHARDEFLRGNPHALGAQGKLSALQKALKIKEGRRDRLSQASERTPLFQHPFHKPRAKPLTRHELIKYGLFQVGALAGIGLGTHVLAVYIANSDIIPDLSGHYLPSLLFAGLPFTFALGIKALGILPDLEEDKPRYVRQLRWVAGLAGLGFIITVALAFAPHTVDMAALSDILAAGADPTGAWSKTVKTLAPYGLVFFHLLGEVALAPLLAMGADAIHASGREVVEQFSSRQKLIEGELDTLQADIQRLNQDVAGAALEAELFAAAESNAINAATDRFRGLQIDLDRHLVNARTQFLSGDTGRTA